MNQLEVVSCASKERCVAKDLPQSTAHNCPGCGLCIHALCGHLHDDASIRYKTTCFFCYEKYGGALKDPVNTEAISSPEETVTIVATTMITENITTEEENQVAMLEDGITIKPPHVQYRQQLTVAEREVKEAKRIANKTKANECMNLSNIKGNMRAKSTMNHHQKEHELFILYLYKHEDQLLEEELLQAIKEDTDLIEDIPIHMKRARMVIKVFLEQDSSYQTNPIKFDLLTASAFAKYLGSLTHHVTGCLLSQKMYKNKKTSLFRLFKLYKYKWTEEFDDELKDLIAGIKRIASKVKQEGLGSLEEGKRELSFDLYKKINFWFIENGTSAAVFARAFYA